MKRFFSREEPVTTSEENSSPDFASSFSDTQRHIGRLAQLLKSPVVSYWNNDGGSICSNDVSALREVIAEIEGADTLYLLIKSSGGYGAASLRMIHMLRQRCNSLVALVPLECASAGTLLALGADKIVMGDTAYLTAIDTSLTHDLSPIDRDNYKVSVNIDELNRIVSRWRSQGSSTDANPYSFLFQYIHPLVIGAVDRAESLSVRLCQDLLAYHVFDVDKAQQIAISLNSGYPSHGYPILMREAERLGLIVEEMTDDVFNAVRDLHVVYGEFGQKWVKDYDETRYHSDETMNVIETVGKRLYYQSKKDFYYRIDERKWVTMNDVSNWKISEIKADKITNSVFYP